MLLKKMATCELTLNFSNIFIAKMYVDSFNVQNQLVKHFVPYLFILGVIFNLAFLFVVARLKRMRTIPNFYISMQATADCLYLMAQMGPTFWRVVNMHRAGPDNRGNWFNLMENKVSVFESRFGCFIEHFSYSFCYYVSIGVVIAVSYDRYLAVVHPLRYQRCKNRKHTLKVCAGILSFGLFLGAARGFMHSKYTILCYIWPESYEFDSFHRITHYCMRLDDFITPTVLNIVSNVIFVTAILLTSVFYTMIVYKLSSRKVASNNRQVILVRNQVARVVVITGCVFYICQLPYRVGTIIAMIDRFTSFQLSPIRKFIFGSMAFGTHLNCALNVVLFIMLNLHYRRLCWEAFRCRCTRPN